MRARSLWTLLAPAIAVWACSDSPTAPTEPGPPSFVPPPSLTTIVIGDPDECDPWLDLGWCEPDPCASSIGLSVPVDGTGKAEGGRKGKEGTGGTVTTQDCGGDGGGGGGGGGGGSAPAYEAITETEWYFYCNPDYEPGCVLRNHWLWEPRELLNWLLAEQRAWDFGCKSEYNVLVAQYVSTQAKMYDQETERYGGFLWGHVDPNTWQIRMWTGSEARDIIHEAVHVNLHEIHDTPAVIARTYECGGWHRGV